MQAEEAQAMARRMVDVYAEFAINGAAMPVIAGAHPAPCGTARLSLPGSHLSCTLLTVPKVYSS